jgi:phosphatidylglycerophosphatase A
VVTCIFWYWAQAGRALSFTYQFIVTLCITIIGVWAAGKMEVLWGKDDKKVVIDEVAGMCISLLFLPVTLPIVLAGLILFRFFDIAKPLFIKRTEDDVVAGLYTNVLLQIAFHLNWL